MKSKNIILMILLFVGVAVHAQKELDKFEVQVDGLGCPFCAYGLEKKFKEFKGIKKVAIDIETGDFSFLYPSEKNLTMDAVITQVEKAGYTPNEAKITRANGDIETSGGITTELTEESIVVSQQLFVAGKCGMCEARIENAALQVVGVTGAKWKQEQQIMKVTFDKSQTTTDSIQKAMATIGHDTKGHLATQEAYNNLPACCHYERLQQ